MKHAGTGTSRRGEFEDRQGTGKKYSPYGAHELKTQRGNACSSGDKEHLGR